MNLIENILRGKVIGGFVAIASTLTAQEKTSVASAMGIVSVPATIDVTKLSFKERLNLVDEMLATNDNTSRDLANVLTALRAIDKPADERAKFKATGTAVIRGVAFPKTAAAGKNLGWETATGTTVRTTGKNADGHYNRHLRQAARALGLNVLTGQ